MKTKFGFLENVFLLIFIVIGETMSSRFSLRPKEIKVDEVKNCTTMKNSPMVLEQFDLSQPERQKYHLNATLRVLNEIDPNMVFKLYVRRCPMSATYCEQQETVTVQNVCKRINDNNAIWSQVFSSITPKLSCPIQKGVYHAEGASFDLSIIGLLPIEPERLHVNLTLFGNGKESSLDEKQTKKPLICVDAKVAITQSRISPKRNRN